MTKTTKPRQLLAVLICAALCHASAACPAAERVALVIGNSKYEGEAVLRNPANDADAMEGRSRDWGLLSS